MSLVSVYTHDRPGLPVSFLFCAIRLIMFVMDSSFIRQLQQSGSTRYLDNNGVVRDPPGVFVLDSSGNLIVSSPPVLKRSSKINRNEASIDDLLKLKESIERDSDVSYDKQLKQAVALVERASSWDSEATHELTALRWCWNVLLWRPGKSKVTRKNPMNPYMK